MKTIGVIYCPANINEAVLVNNLHKIAPVTLTKFLLKRLPPVWESITMEKLGVEVITIQYPLTAEVFERASENSIRKMCIKVEAYLRKLNIHRIVLEDGIASNRTAGTYFKSLEAIRCFDGRRLFVLCFEDILGLICKFLKIGMSSLKVGIISDTPNSIQTGIIKRIAREIRFLSILTSNQDSFTSIVESIYEDMGLVIQVNNNIYNTLNDCSIVINFSYDSRIIDQCKLYDRAVIINYGGDIQRRDLKGIVINDIIMQTASISLKQYPWAGRSGFCEALIAGEADENLLMKHDSDSSEVLKKMGYTAVEFIGRNGKIDMSEFRKLVTDYKNRKIV